MPEPLNARTADDGLRYYQWDNERLISVTSLRRIVGMSMQLHNWANTQVVQAAVAMRGDSETFSLTDDEYAKAVRRAGTLKRDTAAALGTQVHEAASQGIRSVALPATDERKQFLEQYEKAVETLGWHVVLSEAQVFDLTRRYAGSLDLIAYDDTDYVLVDIKTGKGVYPDAAIQLQLYREAEFCGGFDPIEDKDVIDEEATEFLKAVTKMGVLHLRADEFDAKSGALVTPAYWEFIEIPTTPTLILAAHNLIQFAEWTAEHPDITSLTV